MKRIKDLLFTAVVVGGGVAFFLTGSAPVTAGSAPDGASAGAREPEVVAATFSSAWCTACKILKPKLASVIPDFESAPVEFVEFNYTFGRPREYRDVAAARGFADIYDRFEGGTGFTLLIDADNGEILDMLTMTYSKKAMRAAIGQAVAIASRDGTSEEEEHRAP
ncbi:MAG: thioredoxin [Parvularculaceae bacterium]